MTVTPEISRAFAETEDLTPESVELFLRTTGWRRTQFRSGVSAIWENSDVNASLMLPYNLAYRDYRPRLKEALAIIAAVHGIGLDALPVEIASASNDILFLRADQYAAGGSIPLREAQALLDGVSRMMLAAACSAIRPKASNRGRRPAAAHEFVHHDLRMGHTLRGGFVMTILARHDDAYLPLEPEVVTLGEADGLRLQSHAPTSARLEHGDVEPFSRRVMATLATGLEAARELLDPKEEISLDEAVERGASLELVESVGRMGAQDGVRALDLAFLWSPSQQVHPDVPQRIVVPRPDPERVEYVSESLKNRLVLEQDDLVGQVIRLERSEGKEGEGQEGKGQEGKGQEGVVVVDGHFGQTRRRVRMKLSGDAHRTAIKAYELRQPIVASGEVALIKRSWWLVGNVEMHLRGHPEG